MSRSLPAGLVRFAFDAARCDGHGMCSLRCPERISLDFWGYAVCDPRPFNDPGLRRKAEAAMRCCPEGALALVPAGPPGGLPA